MKTTLKLFLIIFLCGNAALSQNEKAIAVSSPKTFPNSFILHGSLTGEQISFYTKSIEAADFEQYRLKDAAVELEFKNGFKLELLSAKDLTIKNKNQTINPNTYTARIDQPSYKYPVFEILKSGWIIGEAQTTTGTKK
jgi:hypothetical protein